MKYDCIMYSINQQHVYFAAHFDRKGFKTLTTQMNQYLIFNQYLIYPNFQKSSPKISRLKKFLKKKEKITRECESES